MNMLSDGLRGLFAKSLRACIGTHTLWNSRMGKIRLFVLCEFEGWFSDPF
jgi:hypothetical protein